MTNKQLAQAAARKYYDDSSLILEAIILTALDTATAADKKRIKELEGALKPLADGYVFHKHKPDNHIIIITPYKWSISISDLRRAAEVLGDNDEKK